MPRALPEWIGATPDTPAPPRVKARVLIRFKRKCHRTGLRIRSGAAWDIEHVIAIINGGENREDEPRPDPPRQSASRQDQRRRRRKVEGRSHAPQGSRHLPEVAFQDSLAQVSEASGRRGMA